MQEPGRHPLLHRWASLRQSLVDGSGDDAVRWRCLGLLFTAAALMALVSATLLPAPASVDRIAVALISTTALVCGALMTLFPDRLPSGDGAVSASLAAGTLLITGNVVATDDVDSLYAMIYIWVGFDAVFFLGRRAAVGHVLFAGACYAATLVAMSGHGEGAAARWLFTMGTVTMVAWMTDVLTDRSDRLIDRLRDATLRDPLTGLFNRRGFERLIDLELERGRRGEGPFTLVVGDLDHFKSINDHFGHHHGDQVLQRFSEILTSSKRSIDSAIRMGGEEFALILPGADSSGGHQLAERMRTRVREELADMGRGVSVSFGVATWPTHGTDSAELLRHGDEALYRAKTMGRDRTVIFGHELADEAPQA